MKKVTLFTLGLVFSNVFFLFGQAEEQVFLSSQSKYYHLTLLDYSFKSYESSYFLSTFNDKPDIVEIAPKGELPLSITYHGKTTVFEDGEYANTVFATKLNEPLVASDKPQPFHQVLIGGKPYIYREIDNLKLGDHEILTLYQDTEAVVFFDRNEIFKKQENREGTLYIALRWFREYYLMYLANTSRETVESKLKQLLAINDEDFDGSNEGQPNDLEFLGTYLLSQSSTRYSIPKYVDVSKLVKQKTYLTLDSRRSDSDERQPPTLTLFIDNKVVAEGDFGLLHTNGKDWMAATATDGKMLVKGSQFSEKVVDFGPATTLFNKVNCITNTTFINNKTYTNKLNGFLIYSAPDISESDSTSAIDNIKHMNVRGDITNYLDVFPEPLKKANDSTRMSNFIWYLPKKGADFEYYAISTDAGDIKSSYLVYTMFFPDGTGINFKPDHAIYIPSEGAYYFLIKDHPRRDSGSLIKLTIAE